MLTLKRYYNSHTGKTSQYLDTGHEHFQTSEENYDWLIEQRKHWSRKVQDKTLLKEQTKQYHKYLKALNQILLWWEGKLPRLQYCGGTPAFSIELKNELDHFFNELELRDYQDEKIREISF